MVPRHQSRRTVRIVGGLLAAAWLAAGFVGVVVAAVTLRWVPAVVGLAALYYGIVWVRVVRQGRLLTVREALMPWRLNRHSDA